MMRVYEIAKLLGMRNKDLLRKIRALGLEVRSHMSPLGDDAVARIRLSIEAERASGGHSEPPHTAKVGLVARRRMAEDVDVQSAAVSRVSLLNGTSGIPLCLWPITNLRWD